MSDSTRCRVLFVVGSDAATSIPLEVVQYLDRQDFAVTVASYYDSMESESSTVVLGARGVFDARGWHKLFTYIRTLRPHVLHLNHTIPALLGSLSGSILQVPALIVSEHHDHRDLGWSRVAANLAPLALADVVTCNSDYTNRSFYWWEERLTRNSRITVYNGVDAERIESCRVASSLAREQLGVSADEFVVGTVGRLVREKDQATMIRAAAKSLERTATMRFVIVGDGPLRSELENLAESLGVGDRLIFLGNQPRERVYEILHALDLFVMSSVTEGFCNAVVEAMVAGVPVVVTRSGALPEVVGDAGIYVPPGSPEALARAIGAVMETDTAKRREMGHAGRERAIRHFSVRKTAARYGQLYWQTLQAKGYAKDQSLLDFK